MSIPDPASPAPLEGDASRRVRRRIGIQFSLSSLLLLMALLASGYVFLRDLRPWVPTTRINLYRFEKNGQLLSCDSPFFSPDGRRVFLARIVNRSPGRPFGMNTEVFAWDVDSGREVAVLHTDTHPAGDLPLAFFPDGRRLAVAHRDNTVRILETTTFKEVVVLRGHLASVRFIRIFPDGRRVLTAAFDGTAKVWDATTGRAIVRLDTSHLPEIPRDFNDIPHWQIEFLDADISRDGTRVAAVAKSPISRTPFGVWDAGSGALVATLDSDRYCGSQAVSSAFIRFVMDGRGVVADVGEYAIGLFDARDGRKKAVYRFPCGACEGCWDTVEVSPDRNRIYAHADQHRLVVCDVRNGASRVVSETASRSLTRHGAAQWNLLSVSSDGLRVLTCRSERPPRIRDAETLELLDELTEPWSPDGQSCAAFSTDGRKVAVLSVVVSTLDIWARRRPEPWWGFACLAELWIALGAAIALTVSLKRHGRKTEEP